MNAGLQYPDSITACGAWEQTEWKQPGRGELGVSMRPCPEQCLAETASKRCLPAWLVLPISVVNGASLLTNNTALLHGGVAFVSMVSSCTPMFCFLLELGRRRRTLDFLTAFSVVLVCAGSAFCVKGEKTASLLALLFASMASLFRAVKSVWQHARGPRGLPCLAIKQLVASAELTQGPVLCLSLGQASMAGTETLGSTGSKHHGTGNYREFT
eukprot:Skav226147  [mRNA]  locus=scaffold1065:138519:148874:- [translate_table: standard]